MRHCTAQHRRRRFARCNNNHTAIRVVWQGGHMTRDCGLGIGLINRCLKC
jgi:hypothetical protein